MKNTKQKKIVIWRLLDGKTGHEKQTLSLINALRHETAIKTIDIKIRSFVYSILLRGELRKIQAFESIKLIKEFMKLYPKKINIVNQKGKSSFYKKRQLSDSKIDINKTIKENFNHLRIVDNKNYPAYFYFKRKKYILKIFPG